MYKIEFIVLKQKKKEEMGQEAECSREKSECWESCVKISVLCQQGKWLFVQPWFKLTLSIFFIRENSFGLKWLDSRQLFSCLNQTSALSITGHKTPSPSASSGSAECSYQLDMENK